MSVFLVRKTNCSPTPYYSYRAYRMMLYESLSSKDSSPELLYADDTLICNEDEDTTESILWAIEEISGAFGLNLNEGKCLQLSIIPTVMPSRAARRPFNV